MNIELKEITVRDLTNNYQDNNEEGVVGYGGKLDIRPPYQREFIYKDKQRDEQEQILNNKLNDKKVKEYKMKFLLEGDLL